MKEILPKPLDKIPGKDASHASLNSRIPTKLNEVKMLNVEQSEIPQSGEVKSRNAGNTLTNSKTLWGFGIAILIYAIQQILVALNLVGPDNLLVKAGIEVIIAVASFFGIYGIRDALRKLKDPQL